MRPVLRVATSLLLLGLLPSPALPHYHMFFPQLASAKKGEAVVLLYQWGHPFEHQLFDASVPETIFAVAPDGKKSDLSKTIEKFTIPTVDQKKVTACRFRFTPEQRGDYVFSLTTAPVWLEEDQHFVQDTVKAVLHVQAQKGWDAATGQAFEMMPLTRPYGLHPGMVFQAQAIAAGKPLANALVEVERYNASAPKQLPPDEHITRTAKTDPNGVVTCTLTEPGWWCITAQRDGGKKERVGKSYPLKRRAILWVHVDEKR